MAEPIIIDIQVNKANFEKQLKDGERVARDTKKNISQDLKFQLEFNIANFQQKLADVKKQLKTATWDNKIALQVDANALQRWLTESKRQLNNLVNTWDATVSRLQTKFNQLWASISNSFSRVGWIIASLWIASFFKWVIAEAQEAARATAQLNAVIKSTWGAAWLSSKEIQSMATELWKLNGIDNDVVASAQNMLLTFTNIKWWVFKEATQAVLDLATAMNGGLTPSAEELSKTSIQVGKALNDPIKWITALQKVWVTFDDTQKKQIANFIKQWDVAAADRIIIAELNKEFGGSAQAQLETYGGKVQALNVRIWEMKESIWNALIPVLAKIIWFFSPVIDSVKQFTDENPKLSSSVWIVTISVTALATAIAFLWWPITLVIAWLWLLTAAWISFTNFVNNGIDTIRRYRAWLEDANWNLTETWKAFEAMEKKARENKAAIEANNSSIQAFNKLNINQTGTRAEFERTRATAVSAALANIALAKSFLAVALASKSVGTFWGKEFGTSFGKLFSLWGVWADAIIEKQNAIIKQNQKDLNTALNWVFTWAWNGPWGAGWWQSKAQKELEKLKDVSKQAFESIDKNIDKSASKIDEYTTKIADLKQWLIDLSTERDKDIASRVATIDQELKKTWEEAVAADERLRLEKERAEAFAWLTAEEKTALDEKIKKQTEFNALSEVWKIKATFEDKKKEIDDKLKIEEEGKAKELVIHQVFLDAKALADQNYTNQFKAQLLEQKKAVDSMTQSLINQAVAAANVKWVAWVWNTITTTNNTKWDTNITVTWGSLWLDVIKGASK